MSTLTHETSRGQSESDTLLDAESMLAAAKADPDVAKKLGPAYLKQMQEDVDHATELVAGKVAIRHDKLSEAAHLRELGGALLSVMQDIRDSADEQPAATQTALGRGDSWSADKPEALAKVAHGIAAFLHAHKDVAKAIGLDAQHAHDLAHHADAIDEAHEHHRSLMSASKSDAIARRALMATLRASAHHVRLKARIAHRHDAAKLAGFTSPIARHVVSHHEQPASPPAAT